MKWSSALALAALVVVAAFALLSDPEHARQGRDDVAPPPASREGTGPVPDGGPTDPPAPSVGRRTTLEVEVISRLDGRPIAGARVATSDGEAARTDERGRAVLRVPRGRDVSLLATREGYEPEHYYFRPDEEDAPAIALKPGPAVAGRVTRAESGAPAVGAYVRVRWSRNRTTTLRTDARGRFDIPGIEPGGTVALTARQEGYAPVTQRLRAAPGRTHVEILLGRGVVCEGRVADGTGRPVRDARVIVAFELVEPAEHLLRLGPWEGARTRTNEDGGFRVRGLETGPHVAVALTDDFLFGSDRFLAAADRPTYRGEIVVRPCAYVVLALLGPEDRPVADARATIYKGSHRYDTTYFEPDPDVPGRYSAGPLAAGAHRISVSMPGRRTAHRSVEIAEGECTEIEWRLKAGLSLQGVVVDASGRRLRGARADFQSPTGRAFLHTGEDGTFRLRGLGPEQGTLEVEADRAGYLPQSRDVRPGGKPLRIQLQQRPRVVGRLDPVPRSRLLRAFVGHAVEVSGTNTRVRRDGSFEVRWVPANRDFWLRLRVDAALPWVYTGLRLAPGQIHDVGVLQPVVAVTLRGSVTDERGRPIKGVQIDAGSAIEDLMVHGRGKTDGDGAFVVRGLVDIDLVVELDHEGYATRTIEVDRAGSSGPLIVVMRRAGFLELAGAEPEARVRVESRDEGTEITVITDRKGRGRVKLAPGGYRVGDRSFVIRVDLTTKVDLGH